MQGQRRADYAVCVSAGDGCMMKKKKRDKLVMLGWEFVHLIGSLGVLYMTVKRLQKRGK